jgi:outer membrane protein TolC
MNRKLTKISVVTFLFFVLSISNIFSGESKEVSLEDCILMALKNNLSVAIEVLNPELSKLSVSKAKEKFMPEFSFSFNQRSTESASYSWLDSATQVETKFRDYTLNASQFLPTGGSVSLSVVTDKIDSNRNFQTINPRFDSTLRLDVSQPLLKNFGININRREITIARNNRTISLSRFKSLLLDTIYQVENGYWNLVYSIENLAVKQQSLKLAKELLAKNKKSVQIGSLAPIEIKTAEAEVATREADILEAEALIRNNVDNLRTIINLNAGRGDPDIDIIPTDKPESGNKGIVLQEAIRIAFEKRPDLTENKINIKNKKLDLKYAKNQLMPGLDLQASYWSPGVSGTQILYLDGNPLSNIIIGTVPGAGTESMKDALSFLYNNWSVSLALSVPLSSIISRADVSQAIVSLKQSELLLKDKEQQVLLEIKNVVRDVETNYKRVKAYRVARELTGEKLRAEEEKLRVGLSTNYDLLLAQRDFADARSSELKAIVDYSVSLANQQKVLGITLDEKNIKMKELQ